MLNSSHDKIGLNVKFERAFVLSLKNIFGPLVVTHYSRNNTTYYHHRSQQCSDGLRCMALKPCDCGGIRFEPQQIFTGDFRLS